MRVECLSCGHIADRVLRPDDHRKPQDILARGRCGQCRTAMNTGQVRLSFDGGETWWQEARPVSRRAKHRPRGSAWIDSGRSNHQPGRPPKPPPSLRQIGAWLWQSLALGAVGAVATSFLVGVFMLLSPVLLAIAFWFAESNERMFSEAALQSSYNLRDAGERRAFCADYIHIVDGRTVWIPGETAALRDTYLEVCPPYQPPKRRAMADAR